MSPYTGAAAAGWPHPTVTMATQSATSQHHSTLLSSSCFPVSKWLSQDDREAKIWRVCLMSQLSMVHVDGVFGYFNILNIWTEWNIPIQHFMFLSCFVPSNGNSNDDFEQWSSDAFFQIQLDIFGVPTRIKNTFWWVQKTFAQMMATQDEFGVTMQHGCRLHEKRVEQLI